MTVEAWDIIDSMSPILDTSAEAQRVWHETFRRMPVDGKVRLLRQTFADARTLHAAGYRCSHPGADRRAVHNHWLAMHFDLEPSMQGIPSMAEELSNLDVLREVLSVFARLNIPHALGGSMASSLHGVARFTLDADVAADPFPDKIGAFVTSFGPAYYVSEPAIEDAHRQRSSFNLIHTVAGFKVDVFVRPDAPFEESAMLRRQSISLGDAATPIAVLSPEDVVLFKLRWFRLGNETARQQWEDVLGVLRTQAGKLDQEYLRKWATDLAIGDLLEKALQDAAALSPS